MTKAEKSELGSETPQEEVEGSQEIKIESAEQGAKMIREVVDEMVGQLPDEKNLMKRISLGMGREHFTEALNLSQQMSLCAELKILQEKIIKGFKKENLDNSAYSTMLPHSTDIERLDGHLRTPYNREQQISAESFEGEMLGRIARLSEIVKQTREFIDPKKAQERQDGKDLENAREQVDRAFGGK